MFSKYSFNLEFMKKKKTCRSVKIQNTQLEIYRIILPSLHFDYFYFDNFQFNI